MHTTRSAPRPSAFSEAALARVISMTKGQRVIFSVCSRNYLHYARALFASLRSHMQDAAFLLVLADGEDEDGEDLKAFVGTEVIPVSVIGIPTMFDMAMRYNVTEFNTSIKPYVFEWLFELGAVSVIYLDPDTYFYRKPTEVFIALDDEQMDAVVTPHLTKPLDMDKRPSELRILQTGVYNLGFLALARSEATTAFVRWWASFMPADCRSDLKSGIFVDQKYIDLLPSYVPRTTILRHPGYNTAYWNLVHRPVKASGGEWEAGGAPLVFIHFSGVRADDDQTVSVHQDRLSYDDLGDGKQLFDAYRQVLRDGLATLQTQGISRSYAFGRFTDGAIIEGPIRKLYAKTIPPRAASFEEAFDPGLPFYSAPSAKIQHSERPLVSSVMYDLWQRKGHLQKTFDLKNPSQTEAFALWMATAGHQEWKIQKDHVPEAVWQRLQERRSLRFKLSAFYFVLAQTIKRFSFIFPKPMRRLGVRLNRAILPRVIGRAK